MTPQIGPTCEWVRQPDYSDTHQFAIQQVRDLVDEFPSLNAKQRTQSFLVRGISVALDYGLTYAMAPQRQVCS